MKIYTKTGDDGETGLFAAARVRKDHFRIEAYGTVDELNAVLGLARTAAPPDAIAVLLARLQHELFVLGAELATPDPARQGDMIVRGEQVQALEAAIDCFEEPLAPLQQFILPGGTLAAAHLHVARVVCRRAERRVVTLAAAPGERVRGEVIQYLNRLSDLLFVLARAANAAAGTADVPWRKPEAGA